MKNLRVLSSESLFFDLASLRKVRQGIGYSICLVLAIIDLKMVRKELLRPPDLSETQVLDIYELSKILIVSKNKDLVFANF